MEREEATRRARGTELNDAGLSKHEHTSARRRLNTSVVGAGPGLTALGLSGVAPRVAHLVRPRRWAETLLGALEQRTEHQEV
jgi:hypothetical protein